MSTRPRNKRGQCAHNNIRTWLTLLPPSPSPPANVEAKPANTGVETDDRSAAVIEPDLAPAHDVANARRNSLSQIADNFKGMEAESAAKLNEGVVTDDRSHANVELISGVHESVHAGATLCTSELTFASVARFENAATTLRLRRLTT